MQEKQVVVYSQKLSKERLKSEEAFYSSKCCLSKMRIKD